MRYLYNDTQALDKRAISKYCLSDELLMENAANALKELIGSLTHKHSVVCIVCGSGDNGGDGYALARKLVGDYRVRIYEAKEPKSSLCRIQSERTRLAGCEWVKKILPCDVVVDCVFGSGYSGELELELQKLFKLMETNARIKVACDMPSGLNLQGIAAAGSFSADYTMSMGALKCALFADSAKDIVGEVRVGDLGVTRSLFEVQSPFFLLESSDLHLPRREQHNCHKGTFGHTLIVSGEKIGAAMLSALSALRIGSGLVSTLAYASLHAQLESSTQINTQDSSDADSTTQALCTQSLAPISLTNTQACVSTSLTSVSPYIEIMTQQHIPHNVNVICCGMGLGVAPLLLPHIATLLECGKLSCVLDADSMYDAFVPILLRNYAKHLVLTPHPKEFHALLKLCHLIDEDTSLESTIQNRLHLAMAFNEAYKDSTLLLKGANPIIAHQGKLYINPLGTNALAKGGSGDVLSGLIAGYLAQGFSTLESTINASLAHAIAARKEKNAYALTPQRLIDHIGNL